MRGSGGASAPTTETETSWRGKGIALAVSSAIALWMVFSGGRQPTREVVGDNGDATWMLWLLDWVGKGLGKGLGGLFNAPIFYPNKGTYGFSESLLTQALLFVPLRAVTGSAALASNVIVLAAVVMSTYWAWRLLGRISGNDFVAFAGALAWAYSSERMNRITLFQMTTAVALVPLVLDRTLTLLERPTRRNGLWLGLATLAMFFAALYYLPLFAVVFVVLVVVWFLATRTIPDRRHVVAFLVAVLVVAVPFGPFALKFKSVSDQYGLKRPPDQTFATHPSDLVHVASNNQYFVDLGLLKASLVNERALFPGSFALGGAVVFAGVWVWRRGARRPIAGTVFDAAPAGRARRAALWSVAAAGAAAYSLSVGDSFHLFGIDFVTPMHLLRRFPAFDGIRAPARYATLGQLALITIAACGVAALIARRSGKVVRAVTVGLCVLVLFESRATVPHSLLPADARWSAVDDLLATRAPGAVAELPMYGPADSLEWPFVEASRLYLATIDGHPRVNGYSGYAPPGFDELVRDLNRFPDQVALERLRAMKVTYVVLRTSVVGNFTAAYAPGMTTQRYTDEEVQKILRDLPPDVAATAVKSGDAYLIELPGAAG